jgi:hypothetical protein
MYKNYCSFPFLLKTESLIKDYIREYFKDSNKNRIYAIGIDMPKDILDAINSELVTYNIKIASGMAFKRKNFIGVSYTDCHVDYSSVHNRTIKSSLVIPIDGCEDTCMYWYNGDYSADVVMPNLDFPYAYPYMKLTWNTPGILVEQVEISNGPMLCRVDVPHSATSRKDGSYRLVMTLRFEENLSIEEIMTRCNLMDRTALS